MQSKQSIHHIDADEEIGDEDLEDESDQVFALQGRYDKLKRSSPAGRTNSADPRKGTANQSQVQCWNCRQMGHMWCECDKRKTIFCHICGYLDTTALRCPNNHDLLPRSEEHQKKRLEEENAGNRTSSVLHEMIPTLPFSTLNRIHQLNTYPHRCPHIVVRVLSEEIEGLADTGVSLSVISSVELIHKLGLKIHPANLQISTADGTPYNCLGYVNLPLSFNSVTHVLPVIVVPEMKKDLILGIDFLDRFGFRLTTTAPAVNLIRPN